MKAVRYDRFGPPEVLRVEDIAEATPAANEVLVRVRAASLNPLDCKIRDGELRFVPVLARPPRGSGCDFAGEIVSIGGGVTRHFVGERVFGSVSPFGRDGSFAEYASVATYKLATIPDGLGFAAAAALPFAAGTALQALQDHARVTAGQRVLVTGAAGGVGHFAVQLAKHAGARVTAVCSGSNVPFVRALGADDAIDYAQEDFVARGGLYEVILDAAGASDYHRCRAVLAPAGIYLNTAGSFGAVARTVFGALAARVSSRHRVVPLALRASAAMWKRLAALAAQGVLVAHVERTIGLGDVAAAQRAMETGHGRGKTIVDPQLGTASGKKGS
jgi:NADPH:quinone reductase-like Zn-dependent oxidoreductase